MHRAQSKPLPMLQHRPQPGALASLLPFVAAALAAFVLLRETWATMIGKWIESETYTHGFIVLPVVVWLVWRERRRLAAVPRRPTAAGLVLMLGCGLLWLAGELAGVNAAQQLAAVAVLPSLVLTLYGWRIAAAIAFPLVYLLFMVPVGEALLPSMMEHTADFTIAALRLTGIPVYREGLHFMIPSGNWSVVEACSGLRYLIASVVLGTLYAYLNYRSWKRRALFIAASLAVPIVANWVRAYMIVMMGHVSGMKVAAGADHLIYGWVFFGIVMGTLFWMGARWREDEEAVAADAASAGPAAAAGLAAAGAAAALPMGTPSPADAPADATGPAAAAGARPVASWALATLAVAVLGACALGLQQLRDATGAVAFDDRIRAAGVLAERTGGIEPLRPAYSGMRAIAAGSYAPDPTVALWGGYFARQHESGEMINYGNTLVAREDSPWRIVAQQRHTPPGGFGDVAEYRLDGPGGTMLVWNWFVVGDAATESPTRAKIETLLRLATGRGDHSVVWTAATRADAPDARERLARAAAAATRASASALAR